MRKTIGVLSALIVVILATFGLTACGGSSSASEQPTSLDGTWVFKQEGFAMVGEVKQNTVELYITSTEKSLYWAGTFKSNAKDGEKINSIANKEQLATSMLGSPDASKEFTLQDGKLSFQMSMMGTTKTIELEKINSSTN